MADVLDLLTPSSVLPHVRGGSRKSVLSDLSAAATACCDDLDASKIFQAVMERERLGSTGVGEGVAIPHARVEGLDRICGAFARLDSPVDFDAIDDQPCDLVFMLLAPVDSSADHLRALARVSRVMRQESLRKALREAQSADAILDCFRSNGNAADTAA